MIDRACGFTPEMKKGTPRLRRAVQAMLDMN